MARCVAALRRCLLDALLDAQHEEAWAALPHRSMVKVQPGQRPSSAPAPRARLVALGGLALPG